MIVTQVRFDFLKKNAFFFEYASIFCVINILDSFTRLNSTTIKRTVYFDAGATHLPLFMKFLA